MQKQRFEDVAAIYVLETKQAFQTERAAWQRSLMAEEQQMAVRGWHEAVAERNKVEHQMTESFRQFVMQQSSQFEQAAQAERKYLATAAKLEVESSRQELILAQTQFQEASPQQSAQINSLRNALSNADVRDSKVREDLRYLRNESESYSQLFENA